MTIYSNLAKEIMYSHLEPDRGKLLLARFRDPAPLEQITCLNCHDLGTLIIQVCDKRIIDHPTNTSAVVAVDPDGKLHIVKETLYFSCPVCNDREDLFGYLANDSGIDESQRDWRLDYIKGEKGKEAAHSACIGLLESVPNPFGFYLLYGNYGTGKSGIMKSIINAMVKAGIAARYVRAADILTEIRASFGSRDLSEKDVLDHYEKYRVLAIDEVDVISETAWAEGALRTLIDRRYDRRTVAATLLATNKPPDELWPYLASRCQDGWRILVAGRDMRAPKQENMKAIAFDRGPEGW